MFIVTASEVEAMLQKWRLVQVDAAALREWARTIYAEGSRQPESDAVNEVLTHLSSLDTNSVAAEVAPLLIGALRSEDAAVALATRLPRAIAHPNASATVQATPSPATEEDERGAWLIAVLFALISLVMGWLSIDGLKSGGTLGLGGRSGNSGQLITGARGVGVAIAYGTLAAASALSAIACFNTNPQRCRSLMSWAKRFFIAGLVLLFSSLRLSGSGP